MCDAAASVELRVDRIPRRGCRLLEDVLSNWAKALQQHQLEQGSVDAQLMRGSLLLDVASFVNEGVLIWRDTLTAVPGAEQQPDGVEVPGVTVYDRATAELLAPAATDNTLLLPGGAAAAKRRQLAQANVGEWVEGGTYEAADDAPLKKRPRALMGRCHNCGSYAHGLSKCPLPVDQKRVNAAMAEVRAERQAANNPMTQLRRRYFDHLPSSSKQERQDGPKPGQISAQLADALGMASCAAPPPWLGRMVALGLPPKYAEQKVEEEQVSEDLMVFFRGSEEEADDAGVQQPGAGSPTAASGAGGGDDDGGGSADGAGSTSSDDNDFIPLEGAADYGKIGQEENDQPQQSPSSLADTGQEPAEVGQGPGQEQRQQRQQQHPPQDGLQGEPKLEGVDGVPKVVFPGVNSGLPPNADEALWTQALRNAAWLQGQIA